MFKMRVGQERLPSREAKTSEPLIGDVCGIGAMQFRLLEKITCRKKSLSLGH
jgi:hypothetical protein